MSWIIVDRSGRAKFETFRKETADRAEALGLKAIEAKQYLADLNAKIANERRGGNT